MSMMSDRSNGASGVDPKVQPEAACETATRPGGPPATGGEITQCAHSDDVAVDLFAAAMKAKLAQKRAEGRGGWETPECTADFLSGLLRDHVEKGDPLDVGNFAMMLHQRGDRIVPSPTGGDEADKLIATASKVARSMGAEFVPEPDKVAAFRAGPAPSPTGGEAVAWATAVANLEIAECEYRKVADGSMTGIPLARFAALQRAIRDVVSVWAAAPPAPVEVVEAAKALEAAERFIVNGIALGFIRMPERDTPDPAHDTLPTIQRARKALARLSGQGAAQ